MDYLIEEFAQIYLGANYKESVVWLVGSQQIFAYTGMLCSLDLVPIRTPAAVMNRL